MCLPLKPFKVEREWEYKGLKCVVVQAREGAHRCGYVRVPPGHPDHGKDYNDVEVSVHGGQKYPGRTYRLPAEHHWLQEEVERETEQLAEQLAQVAHGIKKTLAP